MSQTIDAGSVRRTRIDSPVGEESSGGSADPQPCPPRPFWKLAGVWFLWVIFGLLRGFRPLPVHWGAICGELLAGTYGLWLLGTHPAVRARIVLLLRDVPHPRGLHPESKRATWTWFALGGLVTVGLLTLLEWQQPYFFTQDDNLAQFLPVVLEGGRRFAVGEFSTWNAHQFLGAPTASIGTYALTYPITYVSYSVARWGMNDEFATLDVFCWIHLLAGYVVTYGTARAWGLRPTVAVMTSVCFTLSGFFLIAGRSWFYMTPTAVALPAAFWMIERLRREEPSWGWVLGMGAILGVFFHSGNAQMWVYLSAFVVFAGGLLVAAGNVPARRLIPLAAALMLNVALALPLLVPQFLEAAGVKRTVAHYGIGEALPAMIFPWPLTEYRGHGMNYTPDHERMGQIVYSGTILALLAGVGIYSLVVHRWSRRQFAENIFIPLGLFALVMACGLQGVLWYLGSKLPLLNKFSQPIKYMPFATLFLVLGGGLILERMLRQSARPKRFEAILLSVTLVLMTWHVANPLPSFFSYAFSPNAVLPARLRQAFTAESPQRLLCLAPLRSRSPFYHLSLMHNLPTTYDLYALGGYDPFVQNSPRFLEVEDIIYGTKVLPYVAGGAPWTADDQLRDEREQESRIRPRSLSALRAYGVRWILHFPEDEIPSPFNSGPIRPEENYPLNPWYYRDTRDIGLYNDLQQQLREEGKITGDNLTLLDKPDPLAFAGADKTPLPLEFHGWGARVDVASVESSQTVTVNVLRVPFFRAYVDGRELPLEADEWNRATVCLPAGAHELELVYSPPWITGSLLGLGLGCSVAIGFGAYEKRFQKTPLAETARPQPNCAAL